MPGFFLRADLISFQRRPSCARMRLMMALSAELWRPPKAPVSDSHKGKSMKVRDRRIRAV
jgi:hypothetical protein